MKNQQTREMMGRVYRLIETYEEPPTVNDADEAEIYFRNVIDDCKSVFNSYPGNQFSERLSIALLHAINDRFKAVNQLPLPEKKV